MEEYAPLNLGATPWIMPVSIAGIIPDNGSSGLNGLCAWTSATVVIEPVRCDILAASYEIELALLHREGKR